MPPGYMLILIASELRRIPCTAPVFGVPGATGVVLPPWVVLDTDVVLAPCVELGPCVVLITGVVLTTALLPIDELRRVFTVVVELLWAEE